MASSKTARRSTPSGPAAKFQPADARRVMPLGGGQYAYILSGSTGKLQHVAVPSAAFTAALAELAGVIGADRVRRDLRDAAEFVPAWGEYAENLDALIAPPGEAAEPAA